MLDADLSESTRTHKFAKEFPERFFNVGVAEQNLVGTAAGLALSGLTPYASSFAMFLSGRAWEIVRNSVAYPGLNVKLVASHGGVTVGEDGASHQCIEDFAVMRAIPGMTVICPADFTETKQVIRRIGEFKGPVYVRTGRAAVPVLEHASGYSFREGRGEVLREGSDVTIVACGVLVGEALLAADELAKRNVKATVINMASIKPIDQDLLATWARKTGALVTAEEHNVLAGLGSAVCEALSEVYPVPVVKIGMQDVFGQTGPADALLDYYGLRAKDLVAAAEKAIALKR